MLKSVLFWKTASKEKLPTRINFSPNKPLSTPSYVILHTERINSLWSTPTLIPHFSHLLGFFYQKQLYLVTDFS